MDKKKLKSGAAAPIGTQATEPPPLSEKLERILEATRSSLKSAGLLLVSRDPNDTGGDDTAGNLLLWGARVIDSVLWGEELPPLPKKFTTGLVGRISGNAQYAVLGLLFGLGILQGNLRKTNRIAAAAFRYIEEVLTALLTTGVVPEPPEAIG